MDVVGLYTSIPHEAGIQAIEEAPENRNHKEISTDKLVQMAQQISGTAIETKFGRQYACIFMDQIEIKFLRTQSHQPMVWFRYIDDAFFI